jgi:hypothetical protein
LAGEAQIGVSDSGDGGYCVTGHKVLCRNSQPTCVSQETKTNCLGAVQICDNGYYETLNRTWHSCGGKYACGVCLGIGPNSWTGSVVLSPPGSIASPKPINVPSPGAPNLIQGNWGQVGNYELLVPQGDRLVHYARLNDPGSSQFSWIKVHELSFAGVSRPGTLYRGSNPVAVSFLQTTFRGDHVHGNFDAVVRVTPPGGGGDILEFVALDSAVNQWHRHPLLVDGQPISGVTGNPMLIQGNWGQVGNYELLVPQGDRLVHYARLNDPGPAQFSWIKVHELSFAGVSRPGTLYRGSTPVAVSFLQTTFRGDHVHGNFDAVIRVTPPGGGGDILEFAALDSAVNQWHRHPLLVDGQPISGVTGNPVLMQGNWGQVGNYELLVPQGDRLVHYARLNDPGPAQFSWIKVHELSFAGVSRPGTFYRGSTPVAVSFLQTTFRGDHVHGNFDAVIRVTPPGGGGDILEFAALDSAVNQWHRHPLLVGGQPIGGVTGF